MDYNYLAESLAALAGVPVRVYRGGRFVSLHHHTRFKPDFAITEEENIFRIIGAVGYYMDQNFLYYGLFRIGNGDVALVIGPVSQAPVNRSLAWKILAHMGEPANRAQEVMDYFASIPIYPLRNFLQILCTIQYFTNGEKVNVSSLLLDEEDTPILPSLYAPDKPAPEHFMHNTMELEEQLLSNVEHGRVDEIEKLFQRPVEGRAGSMADRALRQEKNLIICTATLVSRAAIRGGLDPETAFSLSDSFIQKAELLDSLEALTRLNARMVLEFTRRVEGAGFGARSSALIHRAKEYILTNIGEPITTADLSKALGMNRTHLCERFVRETGMTVNGFVTAVKMDEAKRLLTVTKKSATEIAGYLGYSSQSYFVKVFKKTCGVTPGEFQKGITHT